MLKKLPEGKKLEIEDESQKTQVKNGYCTWNDKKTHFVHIPYKFLPLGFDNIKNLFKNLKRDIDNKRNRTMNKYTKEKRIEKLKSLKLSGTEHHALKKGGSVCLMWQNYAGIWYIATHYGIIKSPNVEIKVNYEWSLRRGVKIGMIYFYGKGNMMDNKVYHPLRIKMRRENTVWSWEHTDIELWGTTSTNEKLLKNSIMFGEQMWQNIAHLGNDTMFVNGKQILFKENAYKNNRAKWIKRVSEDGYNVYMFVKGAFRIYSVGLVNVLSGGESLERYKLHVGGGEGI